MVLQQGVCKPRGWMCAGNVRWEGSGHGGCIFEFIWRPDSWWEYSGRQAGEVGRRHVVKGLDAPLVFILFLSSGGSRRFLSRGMRWSHVLTGRRLE